jgi:hypothetical protein
LVNKVIKDMETFFTSFLMGGLGNQMFQISHALCQGWKNNIRVIFKSESHTPNQGEQPTKYINNIFSNIKFQNTLPPTKRVTNVWGFKEISLNLDTNIEFFGYYQSSKNFYGFGENIKEVFSPPEDYLKKIYLEYPELNNKNNISIHIRRGDYIKFSNVSPIIDISYIDKCLENISNYDNIFVLTDDKIWAEKNLNYKNLIIPKNLEDYEELWLISLCRYNIMSNSTFSWWGSYLNKISDKVVFVPSIWFGPQGEKDYEDLYESDWIKIKVDYKNGKLICY